MKRNSALKKHLKRALPIAIEAATEAGAFIEKKYGRYRSLSTKPMAGLVTEADRGAEKIILRTLRKSFPLDHYWGEETGRSEAKWKSPFRWHIDPLDGTTNFVHHVPMFCVSIGLEFENTDSVLGVIYQPMMRELFTATLGGGAYRNNQRIRVSKVATVADALLATGFSLKVDQYQKTEMQSLSKLLNQSHGIRRIGSAALDLAYVAAGRFDGFYERGLANWDVAAGMVLVREAGGAVSNARGERFRLSDDTIVATNEKIQGELLKFIES
ncbi:MAG TPA: inositol monophosphatase family protein [Oligoflexia bacterium]|nr:inositol monophosphatase family protein [Oligoflexia bacterium]